MESTVDRDQSGAVSLRKVNKRKFKLLLKTSTSNFISKVFQRFQQATIATWLHGASRDNKLHAEDRYQHKIQ